MDEFNLHSNLFCSQMGHLCTAGSLTAHKSACDTPTDLSVTVINTVGRITAYELWVWWEYSARVCVNLDIGAALLIQASQTLIHHSLSCVFLACSHP